MFLKGKLLYNKVEKYAKKARVKRRGRKRKTLGCGKAAKGFCFGFDGV